LRGINGGQSGYSLKSNTAAVPFKPMKNRNVDIGTDMIVGRPPNIEFTHPQNRVAQRERLSLLPCRSEILKKTSLETESPE